MLWPNRNPAGPRNVRGDGFSQLGVALRRAVMRPALVERFLGRFHDVRRSREIGFADLQVDHTAALRFQRAGAYQNIEGGFEYEAAHSFCEFHFSHQAYQASARRSAGPRGHPLVAGVLRRSASPTGARDRIEVGAGQLVRAQPDAQPLL